MSAGDGFSIFGFKRLLAERKEKRIKLYQESCKAVSEMAAEKLKRAADAMTARPCPFRDGKCCHTECVHFRGGRFYIDDHAVTGEPIARYRYPSCALWRD